ncbi:hypothetical protein [Ferrimonas senticii]|uniref:hypothetical protein n=1 Tax=Ferrimonas senticii TaxID=394566 RepID=UPI00040B3604|nr:hypothetical protein [Ferrimonas senticii]
MATLAPAKRRLAALFGGLLALLPAAQASELAQPFSEKLYRQALYFYFNGEPQQALIQLQLNQQRYQRDTGKSRLFGAGLQVSLGLHQQASDTLNQLVNNRQLLTTDGRQDQRHLNRAEQLLLIATMQLAQQRLDQQQPQQAQAELNRLQALPLAAIDTPYRSHYQLLQQLANWPQQVNLSEPQPALATAPIEHWYLQLNRALWHLQQQQPLQAEPLLREVRDAPHAVAPQPFWQWLFMPWQTPQPLQQLTPLQQERQALADHATLLLGQLALSQGRPAQAATTLAQMPQQSAYGAEAMALYAEALAQQQQHQAAANIYRQLSDRYRYSPYGWQALLQRADQMAAWGQPRQALTLYQQAAEQLNDIQRQLGQFASRYNSGLAAEIAAELAVLGSAQAATDKPTDDHHDANATPQLQTAATASPWLTLAKQQPQFAALYQQRTALQSLATSLAAQQQRLAWTEHNIELNQQRRSQLQQQHDRQTISATIAALHQQRHALAQQLVSDDKQFPQGQALASVAQRQSLKRLERSQQRVEHLRGTPLTQDYQARLARLQGVINFELHSNYPSAAWGHQKRLQQLDDALAQLTATEQSLATQQPGLADLSQLQQRQAQLAQRFVLQQRQLSRLLLQTQQALSTAIGDFVQQQQQRLRQLSVANQHRIAAVLEQLGTAGEASQGDQGVTP